MSPGTPWPGGYVAVTGGARGIGLATAVEFLRRGARVAIGDVDATARRDAAAGLTGRYGAGQLIALHLDVTGRDSFASFLDQADAAFGPLGVLVNNAGVMPTGLFADEDDAMTDRMIDINLRGVLIGSKLAVRRMTARCGGGRGPNSGHIVNVASLAGVAAFAGVATYCATKHAVLGFTEALQRELAGQGIGVTAVLPGVVRTELSVGHSAPSWVRPVSEVGPNDVAKAIVAAVGTGCTRSVVPAALGAILKSMSLLPDGVRQALERAAGIDTAFTVTDAAAREAYHRRISG